MRITQTTLEILATECDDRRAAWLAQAIDDRWPYAECDVDATGELRMVDLEGNFIG